MIKKMKLFGFLFLFGILFLGFVSAWTSSTPQLSQYGISTSSNIETSCGEGTDFIVQIEPFGCTPAVVRQDLIEENDVPVFCKLAVTKVNPLVNINFIDSVSITGELSPYVSGVAFYPARAALDTDTQLTSSVLENIGYVVINLKKQENVSALENCRDASFLGFPVGEFCVIEGNLTAYLEYDVNEALGFGNAVFYIPELDEEEWEINKDLYQFWGRRGYLKIDSVDVDEATISLYGDNKKISGVTLKKGETSDIIPVPNIACGAGVRLKLVDVENPDTRAQLSINGEIIEVGVGEKFLDNKCVVREIDKKGFSHLVKIKCTEDDKTNTFDLRVSPKLSLNINGVESEVGIGDFLYNDGENAIYLGYAGTKYNSNKIDDLFIYLVSMPKSVGGKLSESDLSSIDFVVGDLIESKQEGSGIIDSVSDALKGIAGASNRLSRLLAYKQKLFRIDFGDSKNVFGTDVFIVNYAGSVDGELFSDYEEHYEKAMTSYDEIINKYSSEIYFGDFSYGEEALSLEIELAYSVNQKRVAAELCEQFKINYPDALIPVPCRLVYKLSSDNSDMTSVLINKKIKTISLEGIYEPTFEEYGVSVTVLDKFGKIHSYNLIKDKVVYLQNDGGDYLQLISATENSAKIKTSISTAGVMDAIKKEFGSDTITLEKDIPKDFADSSITLNEINLKKVAKVSLTSNINDAGTKANFSFQIGIEKRAISLSTNQIENIIEDLNDTIESFEEISDNLGIVVDGLQKTCLATGAILVTKNFISGLGGAGIARQYVMRGAEGWFEKCAGLVDNDEYISIDKCLSDNSEQINKDVESMTKIVDEQNKKIKELQEQSSTTQFLLEQVVNDDSFMKGYSEQVNNKVSQNLDIPDVITDPSGKGDSINKEDILQILDYSGWENNYYSVEDLRNIELYSAVLNDNSASSELKKIAYSELYSELSDIKSNSNYYLERQTISSSLNNVNPSQINSLSSGERTTKLEYQGLTVTNLGKQIPNESSNSPIAIVQTLSGKYSGKKYVIVLDSSGGSSKLPIKNLDGKLAIYDYHSLSLVETNDYPPELLNIYFEKYDSSNYQNPYKNEKLRYYETEPYKGLPAVVPFDLDEGWYAATKQTLPVAGNIRAYDASGKVNSFYLCNVGSNGLEEFSSSSYGDDECILINTGTGQPFSQVPGLSESNAKKFVDCALDAIQQAANAYPATGQVQINTNCGGRIRVSVGEPAVDVPDFACQDFMSPDECLLLFNVCDPVLCPSSRCDFGGSYPVSNVAQTGIIGSLVLCLPNAQEGILIPICLTGVKAGVDSFLSVLTSYRGCLQESLDTGKMAGICDEMYSIYICDFFWEQALPLADIVIPKLIEVMLGQNVRGGGEYLTVQNALENSDKALSYFSNYYGTNIKEAFTLRTKEVIQNEVCKNFVSGVAPSGADLIDSLTTADSPTQFYGKFEENTLTTATVPAISHYKVFYHIYAGENLGAYYKVYLKGNPETSYYQDTSSVLTVASGYVNAGGYATESKDITGTSGYQQLCISVNDQEECGFKSVTTEFAINYAKDEYLSNQAETTKITTQKECISGTTSLYNLLNLNVQEGVESAIDPAIYTQGITRVCATSNPGKNSDTNYDTDNARWVDVGYCDDKNMKCWIDTESVKEVIKTVSVEENTLENLTETTISTLQKEGIYLSESEFNSKVKEIESEEEYGNKILLIEGIFDKSPWSYQKAKLLLLKGDTYFSILRSLIVENKVTSSDITSQGENIPSSEETVETVETTQTYQSAIENVEVNSLSDLQKVVLESTQNLEGKSASRDVYEHCFDAAYQVYRNAKSDYPDLNIKSFCVYSDEEKKSYTIANEKCLKKPCSSDTVSTTIHLSGQPFPYFAVYKNCEKVGTKLSEKDKLSQLQTGDLISYVFRNDSGHNAIFIGWADEENNIASLFDWNGYSNNGPVFRYYKEDLSDDKHPVYVFWRVKSSNKEEFPTEAIIDYLPKDTQEEIYKLDSPTTIVNKEEESVDTNMAARILSEAKEFLGSELGGVGFLRRILYSGLDIKGISSSSMDGVGVASTYNLNELMSELDSNLNFELVNTGILQPGDIVFLGKGCTLPYSVGVFDYSDEDKSYYYASSNVNTLSEVKRMQTKEIFSLDSGIYIYKAYRYKGGKSSSRNPWYLNSAITEIGDLTGKYNDNKQFVDELIFDNLFSETECKKITPTTVLGINFGGGMKISDIHNLLLAKQL